VALSDGRIVLAGGRSAEGFLEDVEVLAPDLSSWSVLPGLLHGLGRVGATVTLLGDDRILVVGGEDESGRALSDAVVMEIDAAQAEVVPLAEARARHSATALPSGTALLAGGGSEGYPLGSVEILLPSLATE
jgi:hypothetical protein